MREKRQQPLNQTFGISKWKYRKTLYASLVLWVLLSILLRRCVGIFLFDITSNFLINLFSYLVFLFHSCMPFAYLLMEIYNFATLTTYVRRRRVMGNHVVRTFSRTLYLLIYVIYLPTSTFFSYHKVHKKSYPKESLQICNGDLKNYCREKTSVTLSFFLKNPLEKD